MMQKKSVQLICNAPYLAHVNLLASNLNIFVLSEVYIYRYAIIMYNVVHGLDVLPSFNCFKDSISGHIIRRTLFLLSRFSVRLVLRLNSVSVNSMSIWNNLEPSNALLPSLNLLEMPCLVS
jgi:hypothetical protein